MQRHLLFKTKLRIHSRKRFGKSPNHCSIRDASIYFPSTSQQNAHKGSSKYVAKIKRTVVMQDGERQKVKSSLVLRVQRSSFARAPQAFSSAHTFSAALWRRWQVEASAALGGRLRARALIWWCWVCWRPPAEHRLSARRRSAGFPPCTAARPATRHLPPAAYSDSLTPHRPAPS